MSARAHRYAMNAVQAVFFMALLTSATAVAGFAIAVHQGVFEQQIASDRYWRNLDEMIARISQENAERAREMARGSAFSNL